MKLTIFFILPKKISLGEFEGFIGGHALTDWKNFIFHLTTGFRTEHMIKDEAYTSQKSR